MKELDLPVESRVAAAMASPEAILPLVQVVGASQLERVLALALEPRLAGAVALSWAEVVVE